MPVGVSSFSLTPAAAITVAANTPITTRWTVPSGRPTSDQVGLYLVGASNDTPVGYMYPNGASTGTYTLGAPATPGTYEFRWRIGYLVAARSAAIIVK
jgi:hypothetical protein